MPGSTKNNLKPRRKSTISEALTQSEALFRAAFDASILGRSLTGPNGHLLRVNRALGEMLGYRPEELMQMSFSDITHPEDLPASRECIRCLLAGEQQTYTLEKRYLHRSGRVIWAEVGTTLLRDDGGHPLYFITDIKDITVQRQVTEERQRLAAIVTSSEDAILSKTLEGRITSWNKAAERIYGYPAEEVLGQSVAMLAPPESKNEILDILNRIKRGERIERFETQRIRKDAALIDLSLTVSPIFDAQGQVMGAATIARDVSVQKRIQDQLKASEEQYRSLFESMINGVAHCQMHYQQGQAADFTYLAVNPAFEKLTGLAQVEGRRVSEVIPGFCQSNPDLLEAYGRVARTGEPQHIESYVPGLNMWFEITAYSPQQDQFVAIFNVITDRKLAEAEIQKLNAGLEEKVRERTAQLTTVNEELESFSYSVSHDLRAPLRAIDGYTRILVEDYQDRLDDEGLRVCGVITESVRKMSRLIDELLAFSRLGRAVMQLSPVDIAAMAREVYFELTTDQERERIDFCIGELPRAWADPTLLRQVLFNLLANAVKFSARQERALIELQGHTEQDEQLFLVRDNGVGFDMQYSDKLFGVFQRLHSSRDFEGTGVGLAVVQRIIARHGGRVWAESEPGQGAIFSFSLPCPATAQDDPYFEAEGENDV